ncbi:MAG: hypothetical protein U0Z26_11795 [Anaerolineales bacterium]
MKIFPNTLFNKIHIIPWTIINYTVSISLFCLVLINREPGFLREISISSRIDFIPMIPILALGIYICYSIRGRLGELFSFSATMILFALPLAGLWASGHTHTTALSGVIPLSDAQSYYTDALRLTSGMNFSAFGARRPFFPGLLAVFLLITNYNLMITLAIFTGLVGITAYFTAREIKNTHGAFISMFTLVMIFLYFRLHSGINMSENLGVILGLLGFSLLWNGASTKKLSVVYSGLFTTSLALNARAGALFTLPFFVIWAGWAFKETKLISWKVLLISLFSVALGFACDLILTRTIATPDGVPFSNFSFSFYGLASGGHSWAYIYEVHPEIFSLPVRDQPGRIYQLAFELIKSQPLLIVKGALFNWKILFSDSLYSLFSYVAHENWPINPLVKWALYGTSLLGIFTCFKSIHDPKKSLIFAGAIGIFLSVPFAQVIDAFRMRPYAASVASMVMIPAIGLDYLLQKTKINFLHKTTEEKNQINEVAILNSALILILILGPILIKQISVKKYIKPSSCGSLETVVIRLDQGTTINLHEKSSDFIDWAPDFHINLFQKEAHSLSNSDMIKWTQTVPADSTLIMTIDRVSNVGMLVVMPTQLTDNTKGRYVQLCGEYESSKPLMDFTQIFYAKKLVNLPNQ